ncbi:MAG: TraB/GumN family protein [Phocaeicola sp.]|nr:TraB/GumN family protein [Prevotellaceae bacterium]MDY3913398.1 TraB/GumN family protein [Phocaeicola sp.]
MNKKLFFALLFLATTFSVSAQLLYKITGKGLEKPSYILGTQHLAPISFVDQIPGLHDALNSAEQVYGELVMDSMMTMEATQKMQAAMMLPEGQSLTTLLSKDQLDRLNAYLKANIGADLTNPMMAQQLGAMTPAGLSMQLSLLMAVRHVQGFDPQNLFDAYFQKKAKEQNKPVGGFETVDFQVRVLYGAPIERQIVQLMCFVDNATIQEETLVSLLNAYAAQNLEKTHEAIEMKLGNECDQTPEERANLIDNRNLAWIKVMPQIMQEKSTFFAVGAGHLLGEKGVLTLLKAAGYTITPVS